jgi:hypothetical protein
VGVGNGVRVTVGETVGVGVRVLVGEATAVAVVVGDGTAVVVAVGNGICVGVAEDKTTATRVTVASGLGIVRVGTGDKNRVGVLVRVGAAITKGTPRP